MAAIVAEPLGHEDYAILSLHITRHVMAMTILDMETDEQHRHNWIDGKIDGNPRADSALAFAARVAHAYEFIRMHTAPDSRFRIISRDSQSDDDDDDPGYLVTIDDEETFEAELKSVYAPEKILDILANGSEVDRAKIGKWSCSKPLKVESAYMTCVECESAPSSCVLLPCRHAVLCGGCWAVLKASLTPSSPPPQCPVPNCANVVDRVLYATFGPD